MNSTTPPPQPTAPNDKDANLPDPFRPLNTTPSLGALRSSDQFIADQHFQTKADIIADIESQIVTGRLTAGTKLPSERDLCRTYAVSRPVIREALSGLAERGHIDISPSRGSFVKAVATDGLADTLTRAATRIGVTARDLVEARIMLECTAAEMAARAGNDAEVKAIFTALAAHESATSLTDTVQTDLAFHEAVARASGNPVIVLMFGAIRPQVHALMLRSHSDRRVHQLGDPIHRQIADAVADHNPATANSAMSEHLSLALQLFGHDLDRPLSEVLADRGLTT